MFSGEKIISIQKCISDLSFIKRCITIIIFIVHFTIVHAQADTITKYTFKIEYQKKQKDRKALPQRDSLYLNFDYSYQNDIISIKTNKRTFFSDTLNVDMLLGFSGRMIIAKKEIKKRFSVYYNGIFLKKIKLKRRFSSVHLEFYKDEKKFIWHYMRYPFYYL